MPKKHEKIPVKHNGKCLCVNVCTHSEDKNTALLSLLCRYFSSELKIFSLASMSKVWGPYIIYWFSSGSHSRARCHNIFIFGRSRFGKFFKFIMSNCLIYHRTIFFLALSLSVPIVYVSEQAYERTITCDRLTFHRNHDTKSVTAPDVPIEKEATNYLI